MNYDVLISLLIVSAVLIAVVLSRRDARSQGAANPVGTAQLQKDVTSLQNKMGRLEVNIEDIRRDLDGAPTKADIARLEERIQGVAGHVENIDKAVVRMTDLLMKSGAVAEPRPSRRR
jgi:peptidoglycan hydrolase CwlO-like protein